MADPAIRETYPADLQAQIIRLTSEIGCAGPVLFVMTFEGRLDPTRLTRAARLLLDAEPMLGCRFVTGPGRPYWRRRDDLDTDTWCLVRETDDPDAVLRELMTPVPEHIERTFRLHLLRRPDGDTLVMWVTHMLADAYAARQCAGLLGEIYSRLREEPGYRPETNPATPMPDSWMRTISFGDALGILRRDVADAREGRGMVHSFDRDFATFARTPPTGADFVKVRIGPNALAAIDRAARQGGNTRNELLTASFLRAFSDFASRGPTAKAQVALTVDLRRFAPRVPQLRTYSMVGMTRVTVRYAAGDPFDTTLKQVKAVLDRQKKALMGAANPLMVRMFEWLPPRARAGDDTQHGAQDHRPADGAEFLQRRARRARRAALRRHRAARVRPGGVPGRAAALHGDGDGICRHADAHLLLSAGRSHAGCRAGLPRARGERLSGRSGAGAELDASRVAAD